MKLHIKGVRSLTSTALLDFRFKFRISSSFNTKLVKQGFPPDFFKMPLRVYLPRAEASYRSLCLSKSVLPFANYKATSACLCADSGLKEYMLYNFMTFLKIPSHTWTFPEVNKNWNQLINQVSEMDSVSKSDTFSLHFLNRFKYTVGQCSAWCWIILSVSVKMTIFCILNNSTDLLLQCSLKSHTETILSRPSLQIPNFFKSWRLPSCSHILF